MPAETGTRTPPATAARPSPALPTDPQALRSAWDGIAAGYDEFVTNTHSRLAEAGLRHAGLGAGMRFLDVAAGSGALGLPAARLGASVLATDLSPSMLERLAARAQAAGLVIETRAMDGHALDLPADSFDVAGSQFGVMLFPDMPRGIAEMARVTKPGGRVLVTAFGDPREVDFFAFFLDALRSVRPGFTGPSMDPPPLPFQLRDPERLQRELTAAGLRDVRVKTTTEQLEFATGAAMWDWLVNSNPIVRGILAHLDLADAETAAIPQALERMVRERAGGNGTAVLTSPVNIGVGTK